MHCDVYRPLLSKYVDQEALPAERAQLESHIAACPSCSRLLTQYRMLRTNVTGLPYYQPDPRMRARLFAALDAADERRTEEITIGRRRALVPVGRQAFAPAGRQLFGNLASAFALVVVVAATALVWQVTGTRPGTALASPTIALSGIAVPVPTDFARVGSTRLPTAQRTGVAALGGKGTARSTAWSPTEAGETVHSVRDEAYGDDLQYPGG
ncbi:MAG TPA: zf-HC2 domain-containing protein, partial [Chloroflexia bacterium]|nr:zf-HC2 domain-containing protein [Chloroflexia bacterium]